MEIQWLQKIKLLSQFFSFMLHFIFDTFCSVLELIPVFSTWSMHIVTKLGTDVFSLWQRLVRLQPNTWSVNRQTRTDESLSSWNTEILTGSWLITFDVSFVSDSLIGGPPCQELLQLHPGFLLVGRVHADRVLHDWGRTAEQWHRLYLSPLHISKPSWTHLCSSWSLGGPSLCLVSQHQETQACPPRWPHLTPRPRPQQQHSTKLHHLI